jgi:hypothetical protein
MTGPAPSICADSSKLEGIWENAVRSTIKLKVFIAVGKINAPRVFVKPNDLTLRYAGINPPLKNIVKTMAKLRYGINRASRLEIQYAPIIVKVIERLSLHTNTIKVLTSPLTICGSLKTIR